MVITFIAVVFYSKATESRAAFNGWGSYDSEID